MNDEGYGSTYREAMKASMSEPVGVGFRERRGWWRRNGAFVGTIAWGIVILAVTTEGLWLYIKSLPHHG